MVDRYLEALDAASLPAALAVIDEALAGGVTPYEIQSGILGRAMAEVGEAWVARRAGVENEHLATELTLRVLPRLRESLRIAPSRSRETVLLAAPAGERHDIGLRMVCDVLEGAGFEVLYLGADVPVAALVAVVEERRPAALGLTCTSSGRTLIDSLRAIAETEHATRVFLGGNGVPEWLRSLEFPWLDQTAGVVGTVERLLGERPEAGVRCSRVPQRLRALHDASPRSRSPLTRRQTQILAGLAEGKSTEQIAAELVLTPVTIRNHVANLLAAMGVHSRLEAVATARRLGLID